jgi:hypothetical protein
VPLEVVIPEDKYSGFTGKYGSVKAHWL